MFQKGSPVKCVCKFVPSLTVGINGRSVPGKSKYFRFSEYSYSIANKVPNLYYYIS